MGECHCAGSFWPCFATSSSTVWTSSWTYWEELKARTLVQLFWTSSWTYREELKACTLAQIDYFVTLYLQNLVFSWLFGIHYCTLKSLFSNLKFWICSFLLFKYCDKNLFSPRRRTDRSWSCNRSKILSLTGNAVNCHFPHQQTASITCRRFVRLKMKNRFTQ